MKDEFNGKGSWQRPHNKDAFDDSFDRIFGNKDAKPKLEVFSRVKPTKGVSDEKQKTA